MSAYDDAVAYLDAEVHPRCDYDIYSYMRDMFDGMEAENAKLRELVRGLEYCVQGSLCDCCPLYDPSGTNHRRCESLERELGIEVDE